MGTGTVKWFSRREGLRVHHARRGWARPLRPLLRHHGRRLPFAERGRQGLLRGGERRQGAEGDQRPEDLEPRAGGTGGHRIPRDRRRRVQCRRCVHRPLLAVAALAAALVARGAPASAKIVEVGRTDAGARACPATPVPAPSRAPPATRSRSATERGALHRARRTARSSPGRSRWATRPPSRSRSSTRACGGAASARLTVLRPGKTLVSRDRGPEPDRSSSRPTSGRPCSSRSAARSTSRRAMSSR